MWLKWLTRFHLITVAGRTKPSCCRDPIMDQHESSGSEDEEDRGLDEFAKAVIEDELGPGYELPQIDPEIKRKQDIIAEVARRRKERDETEARRKSDEIFERFDADGDGFLNFEELHSLGQATGGELAFETYTAVCQEVDANPKQGVTKALLHIMYSDAGLGDPHRDYNLIFRP